MPLQVEVNSVEKLCKFLISCAFQRCRMLDDFCRLSVSLKPTPSAVLMSVSDTGSRSTLEEFQELKYQNDCSIAYKWDGVLCIATTGMSDKEIHHLKFNLKEVVSSRRLVRLPSATKNGAKFSGTEVSLSTYEDIDGLVTMISHFLRKMLLLKEPRIAVELMVESGDSKSIVFQKACSALAMNAANIDHLRSGLEDYVSKHGNRMFEACYTCFSTRKNLKVGIGIACSRENQPNLAEVMEVVIIISDTSMSVQGSCSRLYGRRTEVLNFRDFLPSPISKPSLEALTSIEWKKYGLVLKSVGDQDGVTLLEWENLSPCSHIDIALHRYHRQLPHTQRNTIDRFLTKKAVKLALSDLKKKNAGAGLLLSERAVQICGYAPDLAKTIAGLIMSSHDLKFRRECISLLGLQSHGEEVPIEKCIEDKIIAVTALNDTHGWGTRVASALFEGDVQNEEAICPDEEYEGEDIYI